jgi:hypothetical protein
MWKKVTFFNKIIIYIYDKCIEKYDSFSTCMKVLLLNNLKLSPLGKDKIGIQFCGK